MRLCLVFMLIFLSWHWCIQVRVLYSFIVFENTKLKQLEDSWNIGPYYLSLVLFEINDIHYMGKFGSSATHVWVRVLGKCTLNLFHVTYATLGLKCLWIRFHDKHTGPFATCTFVGWFVMGFNVTFNTSQVISRRPIVTCMVKEGLIAYLNSYSICWHWTEPPTFHKLVKLFITHERSDIHAQMYMELVHLNTTFLF